LSSGQGSDLGRADENPEDDPGEVAFEGPDGLALGLALAPFAGDECLGRRMVLRLDEGDRMERPIELPIAPRLSRIRLL
jgi:hypothetical protein